jgi:predicted esterase
MLILGLSKGIIAHSMDEIARQAKHAFQPPYVVTPTEEHKCTFMFLHGLGSNGQKFGKELLDTGYSSDSKSLTDIFPSAKFIFPTAKVRRSSAFRRATLTQWFDIASLEDPSYKRQNQGEGLTESARYLLNILQLESTTVGPQNLILGGISHGCAMAVCLLLCLEYPLAGFVGMSGWLPFQNDIREILEAKAGAEDDIFGHGEDEEEKCPVKDAIAFERELLGLHSLDSRKCSLSTPVFVGHGEADEKVKCSLGQSLTETLRAMDMDVTWRKYPDQGHWYKMPEEIDDIIEFLSIKAGWKLV